MSSLKWATLIRAPSVYAQEATETEVEVPQTNEEDDQEFEAFKIEEPEEEEETQTDEGYDELEEVPIKISTLPIHPLTDIPEPASDIEVTYKFVDGEECTLFLWPSDPLAFPIGEGINVLIHLRNNGNNLYNITNAMGSLNSASNFGIYYQNVFLSPAASDVPSSLRRTSTLPSIPTMSWLFTTSMVSTTSWIPRTTRWLWPSSTRLRYDPRSWNDP